MENFWVFLMVVASILYSGYKKSKKLEKQKREKALKRSLEDLIINQQEEEAEVRVTEADIVKQQQLKKKLQYKWRDGGDFKNTESDIIIHTNKQKNLKRNKSKQGYKHPAFNLKQAVIYAEILKRKY